MMIGGPSFEQNLPPQSQDRRSSGTLIGQRKQLSWELKSYKILSIDGGGIKGILPAAILAECEKRFTGGKSAGQFFDMIAGTSTGGIIAAGLGIGMPASQVLDIYMEHGAEIFPPRRLSSINLVARVQRGYDIVRSLKRYRYNREPLERRLRAAFGTRIYGETDRRLVIPSFDGFTEVNLFKTPHHPDYKMDWKLPLVTIALATSAAPTFFSVFKDGKKQFADGGVWANNPVMNAVVDALACYAIERRQVSILSLGCGDQEILFTPSQVKYGGLWHWRQIMSSAMHLQSQNAIGQAGLLIGRDQLLRLNPRVAGAPIEMDDYARASAELPDIARQLVDQHEGELAQLFQDHRPAYRAFHGPRASI